MEVEIISKKDNKLLERKEINAVVTFEAATPSRKELREAVGTKLGLNPDLIILNSVVNEFGSKRIRVLAHSYTDMKKLIDTEPEYLRKRDGIGVEKKEEEPAEAPKEEAKKEEKPKEEKPKEEKKEEKPKEEPKKEEKPKEEPKKEEKKEEKPKEEKKPEKKEEKKEEPKKKEGE